MNIRKKERIKKMNKIYNNLSIDNLLETELYKDFNLSQKDEIRKGLEKGLDVSVYTDSEYSDAKMKQIRLGLEKNLDVSIYAKSEFDWSQMKEIRKKLENEQKNI